MLALAFLFTSLAAHADAVIGSVAGGMNASAMAVNTATNRIYVANVDDSNVTVIDGLTLATSSVPAGTGPGTLAVNAVTNRIYVANRGSNDVTVIDGATNGTTTMAVGSGPTDVAVNPVTNKIYTANAKWTTASR
ncbi:MAG: YncE family protein [Betaproteobacteria bacterium]|nr:YncE family protein [Betaproteobacteria bacterium]